MFGLKRKEVETINAAAKALPVPQPISAPVVVVPPPKMAVPEPAPLKARLQEMTEYASVAAQIGLAVPALEIEEFVAVLERLNYPVYSLDAVRAYMDDKAKREAQGWGWHWCSLRAKDKMPAHTFGRPADWGGGNGVVAASDFYASHSHGMGGSRELPLYSRIVPLHALQRIAAIEKEYTKPVHFMVTDYAPKPEFRADPFLMVVIPNEQLGAGIGRFVIDFWDEPGFGIDKMLA